MTSSTSKKKATEKPVAGTQNPSTPKAEKGSKASTSKSSASKSSKAKSSSRKSTSKRTSKRPSVADSAIHEDPIAQKKADANLTPDSKGEPAKGGKGADVAAAKRGTGKGKTTYGAVKSSKQPKNARKPLSRVPAGGVIPPGPHDNPQLEEMKRSEEVNAMNTPAQQQGAGDAKRGHWTDEVKPPAPSEDSPSPDDGGEAPNK